MSPFFPRRLPFHLTVPETSLWYNLEVSATRFPDRPALNFGSSITNYREFHAQSAALAGFLQKVCGVRRGDRVALFMHNSPQFVIAYYGILRADAAVVPINCMNTTGELEQLLRDAGATTVITAQELQPRVEPLLGTKSQGKAVHTPSSPAIGITLATTPAMQRPRPARGAGCTAHGNPERKARSRRSRPGTKRSSRRTRRRRTRPGPTTWR